MTLRFTGRVAHSKDPATGEILGEGDEVPASFPARVRQDYELRGLAHDVPDDELRKLSATELRARIQAKVGADAKLPRDKAGLVTAAVKAGIKA